MSSGPPAPSLSKPLALQHLAQAQQNYKLYRDLQSKGEHVDWAVTVLFYTALHLVQAYFVEVAPTAFEIPKDHTDRESRIRSKLPQIFKEYSFLETRSRWARYRPDKVKPTPAVLQQYQAVQFAHIVAELRKLGVDLE